MENTHTAKKEFEKYASLAANNTPIAAESNIDTLRRILEHHEVNTTSTELWIAAARAKASWEGEYFARNPSYGYDLGCADAAETLKAMRELDQQYQTPETAVALKEATAIAEAARAACKIWSFVERNDRIDNSDFAELAVDIDLSALNAEEANVWLEEARHKIKQAAMTGAVCLTIKAHETTPAAILA